MRLTKTTTEPSQKPIEARNASASPHDTTLETKNMTRSLFMAASVAVLTLSLVGCATKSKTDFEPFGLNSPRVELIATQAKVPITLDGVG